MRIFRRSPRVSLALQVTSSATTVPLSELDQPALMGLIRKRSTYPDQVAEEDSRLSSQTEAGEEYSGYRH